MITGKMDKRGLSVALTILKSGGLVICPSDTVYGVLADAQNNLAVEKLIAFKSRPPGKPVSVFLPGKETISEYVKTDERQQRVLDDLLPGPFTVILPSRHRVQTRLESERGTLGIRIPAFPFINQLVREYGKPVTATSANLSGRPPHYSTETLLSELPKSKSGLIDLTIDGGKLPRNKPSTVIDLSGPQLRIVRHGDIVTRKIGEFVTSAPSETETTARSIVNRLAEPGSSRPLVFILEGDMGAGKTVFVKGAAAIFGVESIISPTFVISYEYDVKREGMRKLVHADLFNIEDPEEFRHLGLEKYLSPGNLMFIEWGEKAGELFDQLKEGSRVIHVSMVYLSETQRKITVKELL